MEKFLNFPSSEFWNNKRVLITGHTGFKGKWLVLFLTYLGAKVYGVSLDNNEFKLKNKLDLSDVLVSSKNLDIVNHTSQLESYLEEANPEVVFHFAAMSILKDCNNFPKLAMETNTLGTFNVIDSSLKKTQCKLIVCATTDKVYKFPEKVNSEKSELGAVEFYGASKVGAEAVIEAFKGNPKFSKNFNFLTIRSGNVLGGGDYGNYRLIPDIVNSLKNNVDINIRNPNSTRPWQYILDSLNGYILSSEYCLKNNKSEIFNLNQEELNRVSVLDLTRKFLSSWESQVEVIIENQIKNIEAEELKITSIKATKILGWKAVADLSYIFKKIKEWETAEEQNLIEISLSQIKEFEKLVLNTSFNDNY